MAAKNHQSGLVEAVNEVGGNAKIIDGKKAADALLEKVKADAAAMKQKPCLAIVLVGDDPASIVYTKKKHEACAKVGIKSLNVRMPAGASEKEVVAQVEKLNNDREVDAILVQLPLPDGIDENRVLEAVALEKDVDGFHPQNFGNLALALPSISPCTPKGIMHLLKESGVSVSGKNAVVIGRSRIVGKPLALLLLNAGATVTICHSKTQGLAAHTLHADIVCSAVGKPRIVTGAMVKDGAVVIDAGTSQEDGRLVGDIDFGPVSKKASLITPVPGGVGPMTIAMLMENTLLCHRARAGGKG